MVKYHERVISEFCDSLDLDDTVERRAVEIMDKLVRRDMLQQYSNSIECVLGAAVYTAAREQEKPIQFYDIVKAEPMRDEETKTEVGECYRKMCDQLNIRVNPLKPRQFVQKHTEALDLHNGVARDAERRLERTDSIKLQGRNPSYVAAAAIYLEAEISQKDAAEVAGTSDYVIRSNANVIEGEEE